VSVGVAVILIFHREKKTEDLPESNEAKLDNEEELSPQPEVLENGENNNREKVSI